MAHQGYLSSIDRYDQLIRKLKRWAAVSTGAMIFAGAVIAFVLPHIGPPFHKHISFALALLLAVSFCVFMLTLVLVLFYSKAKRALARAAASSTQPTRPGLPPS